MFSSDDTFLALNTLNQRRSRSLKYHEVDRTMVELSGIEPLTS